jgi:hypothetical protein
MKKYGFLLTMLIGASSLYGQKTLEKLIALCANNPAAQRSLRYQLARARLFLKNNDITTLRRPAPSSAIPRGEIDNSTDLVFQAFRGSLFADAQVRALCHPSLTDYKPYFFIHVLFKGTTQLPKENPEELEKVEARLIQNMAHLQTQLKDLPE